MQMRNLNIIGILFCTVTCVSNISDDIARFYHFAFFNAFRIRTILTQMCVIIVSGTVQTAYSQTPASVLIPADRFHNTRFNRNDGRACLRHQIMPQMLPFVAVSTLSTKIIIMLKGIIFSNGWISNQTVFVLPNRFSVFWCCFYLIIAYHSTQYRSVCFAVIGIILHSFWERFHCFSRLKFIY